MPLSRHREIRKLELRRRMAEAVIDHHMHGNETLKDHYDGLIESIDDASDHDALAAIDLSLDDVEKPARSATQSSGGGRWTELARVNVTSAADGILLEGLSNDYRAYSLIFDGVRGSAVFNSVHLQFGANDVWSAAGYRNLGFGSGIGHNSSQEDTDSIAIAGQPSFNTGTGLTGGHIPMGIGGSAAGELVIEPLGLANGYRLWIRTHWDRAAHEGYIETFTGHALWATGTPAGVNLLQGQGEAEATSWRVELGHPGTTGNGWSLIVGHAQTGDKGTVTITTSSAGKTIGLLFHGLDVGTELTSADVRTAMLALSDDDATAGFLRPPTTDDQLTGYTADGLIQEGTYQFSAGSNGTKPNAIRLYAPDDDQIVAGRAVLYGLGGG